MPQGHSAELTASVQFIGKNCIEVKSYYTIHGSRRINYDNFARTLIDPSSHSSTIIYHPFTDYFFSIGFWQCSYIISLSQWCIRSLFPSRPFVVDCFVINGLLLYAIVQPPIDLYAVEFSRCCLASLLLHLKIMPPQSPYFIILWLLYWVGSIRKCCKDSSCNFPHSD